MCEGGELFPTRQAVHAACLAQQGIEPTLQDVARFPGARAGRCQSGRESIPIPLWRGQPRPQDAPLEQPAAELPRCAAPARRPELHQYREILVDLSLRLQLELRDLAALAGPVRDVKEVRDPLGSGAEGGEPLLRPWVRGRPRELRQHRIIEEEGDVQLFACATTMGVMGVKQEQLIQGAKCAGATTFLSYAADADVSLFI